MLRIFAFLLCRIFFKRVSVSGAAYTGGGAIWVANHSSAIVDPAVIMGLAPVPVRPLAKHTLWQMPVMRQLLEFAQAISVVRKQDVQRQSLDSENGDEKEQKIDITAANNLAFAQISAALLKGERILMFPEGVSHDDPFIHDLKTGLARMALQTLQIAKKPYFSVIIQPVVIDYSEKDEFRSEVCLHYCEPLVIGPEESSIRDVTSAVRQSLEEGFASFFTWDEKRNWRFLFEVAYGRTPFSSLEFCRFVERFRPLFDADPVLIGKVQTMRRLCQAFRIVPSQVVLAETIYPKKNFFWLIAKQAFFYLFITIPVELLGALVWAIPSKVCELLANRSSESRDLRATMKIAHGLWFFPVWSSFFSLLFAFLLSSFYLPRVNLVFLWFSFLVLTPVFFLLALFVRERVNLFPGFLRLVILKFFFPRGWSELVREWRQFSDEILGKIGLK